jgi:hypothetical protein
MNWNPTPHQSITFYPFADGAALHRQGSYRLLVLNATAATLWCLIDGTRDVSQLARAYGRRFDLEPFAAQKDVEVMLLDFARRGLLHGHAMGEAAGAAVQGWESMLQQITFCVAGCWFRLLCGHKETSGADDRRTAFRRAGCGVAGAAGCGAAGAPVAVVVLPGKRVHDQRPAAG